MVYYSFDSSDDEPMPDADDSVSREIATPATDFKRFHRSQPQPKQTVDRREAFISDVFGYLPPREKQQAIRELTCETPGCPGDITIYGHFCRRCYDQQRRVENRAKMCRTDGCLRTVTFSGYCRACNNQRPKSAKPKRKPTNLIEKAVKDTQFGGLDETHADSRKKQRKAPETKKKKKNLFEMHPMLVDIL